MLLPALFPLSHFELLPNLSSDAAGLAGTPLSKPDAMRYP
ncbi:hypothetical protein GGD57_003271 [Rhizobium esperanzae]|uniref:Uncharacterized protein n=1 Tax=Rhizobium esperanzae TaxID=1967781 RepID=A0A7W6W5U5_9HYPH|nr:hypothetical protein [Rhizobium esperanzae]